jgi:trimethylguanosine synthase
MGKGKRRGGLSGVSKFVLESMKPTSSDTTSNLSKENPSLEQNRPAKRRKGNNGVPMIDQTELAPLKWVDKYDATGLVPHYTHHSQVPTHLQKCMSRCTIFSSTQVHHFFDHRFFAASSIFFSLFRTSWLSS